MNGFLRFLSFLVLPVVLGAGAVLFGLGIVSNSSLSGLSAFFTTSLSSSWAVVFGMAFALPIFLSQWLKVWVVLLIYTVFAALLFFPFAAMAETAPPCYMLAGMYALLGVACWVARSERVAPLGIDPLNWPVPVWVVIVLVLDLVINYLFLSNRSIMHVYLTLAGFVGGMVSALLYCLAVQPGDAASPKRHVSKRSSMMHAAEVQKVHEQVASAPVGARPKISVLDMKMAAVVNDDPNDDRKVTTAKIFVENQDG